MKCQICKQNKATAWFNKKHACWNCWNANKEGYLDKRIERIKNQKKLK